MVEGKKHDPRDLIYEEDEEEEIGDSQEPIEEEIPEAFIPQFTVAPEEIPIEQQVHTPTEEEKAATVADTLKRLGIKATDFLKQEPLPITPEKERFVQGGSKIASTIFSSVFMWAFAIVGGIEYSELAPTQDEAQKIIAPFMRVWARHSKIVATISPDADDISEGLGALSQYLNHTMYILEQIREDKKLYGRSYTGQTRTSNTGDRPATNGRYATDASGATSDSTEPTEADVTGRIDTSTLTEEQRYNYEQLRLLGQRDLAARKRRSGRI